MAVLVLARPKVYYPYMASIVGKKRGNATYYYLVESARVDSNPRIVSQEYLGTAGELAAAMRGGGLGLPDRTGHGEFGAAAAAWGVLEDLGVAAVIDEVAGAGPSGLPLPAGTYLVLAALNRLVAPCSKLAFADWWKTTAAGRFTKIPAAALDHRRFRDAMHAVTLEQLEEASRKIAVRGDDPLQQPLLPLPCTRIRPAPRSTSSSVMAAHSARRMPVSARTRTRASSRGDPLQAARMADSSSRVRTSMTGRWTFGHFILAIGDRRPVPSHSSASRKEKKHLAPVCMDDRWAAWSRGSPIESSHARIIGRVTEVQSLAPRSTAKRYSLRTASQYFLMVCGLLPSVRMNSAKSEMLSVIGSTAASWTTANEDRPVRGTTVWSSAVARGS